MTRLNAIATPPPSRLAALCEGLIEASWLGALLVSALFFNHLSFQSFEPDKAEMLRTLALLAALAWLVRRLEGPIMPSGTLARRQHGVLGSGPGRNWLRSGPLAIPLLLPALLLWFSMALSTALSVDWQVSLWGSYDRRQGLYTATAYLTLFLSVLVLLRRPHQVQRIITTLIVVSVPVSILGLMQYQGIDPIRWSHAGGMTVVSTLGNTIFVAAWLAMIVPLLLHRLLESLGSATRDATGHARLLIAGFTMALLAAQLLTWPNSLASGIAASAAGLGLLLLIGWIFRARFTLLLRVWVHVVVLAIAVGCLLLTERRGPFLAMLAGISLFAMLHLAVRGRWKGFIGMVGATALGLLTLITVPAVAPSLLQGTPFERLTQLHDTGGTAGVRLHIWEGVITASSANSFRALVGYGPDTLQLVIPAFSDQEIAGGRHGLPDRSHNETLDVLETTGLLGMAAYVTFVSSLFLFSLRWTGVIRGAADRRMFVTASVLGMLMFALGIRVLDGSWRFIALGVLGALLFGGLIVSLARSLRKRRGGEAVPASARSAPRQYWVATLFASLIAHLVEVQVGIGIVATQAAFWILAAALVAVGSGRVMPEPANLREANRHLPGLANRGSRSAVVTLGLLVALMLLTLAFNFPLRHFAETHSASILWLFGLTGVLAGCIVLTEVWRRPDDARRRLERFGDIGLYTSLVLLSFSVAGFVFSLPPMTGFELLSPLAAYLIIATLLLTATSVALMPRPKRPVTLRRKGMGAIAYASLLGFTLAVISAMHLRPLQADMLFKRGYLGYQRNGDYQDAVQWLHRAIGLAPGHAQYHLFLGILHANQAARLQNASLRNEAFSEAADAMARAQALRPLHPVYPERLAQLYLRWARTSDDPRMAESLLADALTHYEHAAQRNPNKPELWVHWGDAHAVLGQHASAVEKYRRAVLLAPDSLAARLALGSALLRSGQPDGARQNFEEIIGRWPDTVDAHRGLIMALRQQGHAEAAIAALTDLLNLAPDDMAAHVERIRLYLELADCQRAQQALREAGTTAAADDALAQLTSDAARACAP